MIEETPPLCSGEFSFEAYYQLLENLVETGRTSGNEQSEDKIGLTNVNLRRVQRLLKEVSLNEEQELVLKNLQVQQFWIVIMESWCADGAQNIPIIAKLAEKSGGKVDLKIIFRDENPEIMDQYLTEGNRSIPILIAKNSEDEELFRWGPRPKSALAIADHWRKNKDSIPKKEFLLSLQKWYSGNKGQETLQELLTLLKKSN